LNSQDSTRRSTLEESVDPIRRFTSRKLTRKESIVKREIDSYHVSDVDNTAVIYYGRKALSIYQTLDLPDANCDGLTYKQRLVQTREGECLLIARWKPDRYMRRTALDWSQKWFVEKQLFPPDLVRFFARLEKQAVSANESASPEEASE